MVFNVGDKSVYHNDLKYYNVEYLSENFKIHFGTMSSVIM